jgi:hypothetical protein
MNERVTFLVFSQFRQLIDTLHDCLVKADDLYAYLCGFMGDGFFCHGLRVEILVITISAALIFPI